MAMAPQKGKLLPLWNNNSVFASFNFGTYVHQEGEK